MQLQGLKPCISIAHLLLLNLILPYQNVVAPCTLQSALGDEDEMLRDFATSMRGRWLRIDIKGNQKLLCVEEQLLFYHCFTGEGDICCHHNVVLTLLYRSSVVCISGSSVV